MATKPMTTREKRYVEAYCGEAHYNMTQSARIAGYAKSCARVMGQKLYRRPHVRRAIDRRLDRLSMSSGEITRRLTELAGGTLAPFLAEDEDGTPRIDLSSREAQKNIHLLKKLKVTKKKIPTRDGDEILETKVDIEIHDAKDAMVQLGRIRGLYIERDKDGSAIPNFKVYVGINPDEAL